MRTVETKNEETLAKLDRLMKVHSSDVDLLSAARGESGHLVKAMEALVSAMTNKDKDLKLVLEENAKLKARLESQRTGKGGFEVGGLVTAQVS